MSEKNPTTNESSTKKRRPQSQPQKIAAQALPRQGFLPRLGVNTTHILNPTATLARPGVIVQPAMSVNAPDDQYEVEANRVADAVMRMPTGPISDGWGKKAPTPAKRHLTPAFLQHSGGTSVSHAPLPRLKSAILEENDIVPPAMSVNTPDDHYEVEANRYADAVMRMPTGPIGGGWGKKAPTPAKRHLTPAFLEENDSGSPSVSHAPLPRLNYTFGRQNDSVARSVSHAPLPRLNYTFGRQNDSGAPSVSHRPLPRLNYTFGRQNHSVARAADDAPPAVTPEIENRIGQMDGGGEALPNETRGFFEERMGADFSGVRVHTDGNAAETSQAIQARAFTSGNNIAFNKGEYNPGTSEGKHLLAHELTHTIQQGAAGSLARKVDEGETEQRSPVEAASVEGAENDPDFIAVTEEVGQIAEEQKEHEEAETKADEAAAAAEMPAEEKQGLAENEQAEEIESAATVAQAKDAGFDKSAFKAAIKAKIEAITPSEPEELENIESNGLMGQVKEALTGQIDEGKDSAQGEVDDKIEQEPDPSSVAEKEVTPLSPNDPGSAPRSIDGAKAAPKAKEESDVEEPLAENVKSLDEQMAEAELTDEQLIAANEPEFLAAVESKKEYQTHAESAPVEYRAAETGLLSTSQLDASELTQSETLSMFEGRGQVFGDLDGLQTESKGSDEAKRQEIGQAINQIYQSTKTDVQAILDNLESLVDSAFNQGATKAQQAATAYIKTETQAYKDARYKTDETIDTSGGFMDTLGSVVEAGSEALSGAGNWVADTIVGMPDEYHQIYNVGRDKYIAEMDLVLDDVAKLVGDELGNAKKRIAQGRKEIEEYVAKQPDDLKQIALDAAQNIQGEFDTLEETVDSKADSLVNSLAEKYNENLAELDSQLDTLKEADKGLLEQATDNLSGVIQTINSLRDMLMGVLNSAAEVVTTIIADPIGFLSNLIDGVGQGLQNFVGNIGTHLQTGLSTWLFGEVAKAGIQMPETLDMKGLLELGTQVLGLTWDFIRNRAAKLLGDDVVSQLEETFDLFLIIKEQGMGGLWEEIQEQVGDLKETIIGSIGEMVASEVIEAGIQWLIGILGGPAGAFIKAAKAIYDLVMWFVDNGSQMLELVQAVINSVTAIASGAIGQAAQYVEESLAKAIPVTIGFLASLLGLGDLSSKIKGIIEQAQEPITRAIDWVIGKAKAFAGKMMSKLGLGEKNKKDGEGDNAELTKEERDAGLAANQKGEEGKNTDLTKEERDAGLSAFETEEQKYVKNGTINKEDAQETAKDVSQKHSVFKSITVVDGGDSWDYEYVFRVKIEETRAKKREDINIKDIMLLGEEILKKLTEEEGFIKTTVNANRKGKIQSIEIEDMEPITLAHLVDLEIIEKDLEIVFNFMSDNNKKISELIQLINKVRMGIKRKAKITAMITQIYNLRDLIKKYWIKYEQAKIMGKERSEKINEPSKYPSNLTDWQEKFESLGLKKRDKNLKILFEQSSSPEESEKIMKKALSRTIFFKNRGIQITGHALLRMEERDGKTQDIIDFFTSKEVTRSYFTGMEAHNIVSFFNEIGIAINKETLAIATFMKGKNRRDKRYQNTSNNYTSPISTTDLPATFKQMFNLPIH